MDMDEFTAQLDKLDELLADEGSDLSLGQLFREMISGEREFSLSDIWSTLGDMAFADLKESRFTAGTTYPSLFCGCSADYAQK